MYNFFSKYIFFIYILPLLVATFVEESSSWLIVVPAVLCFYLNFFFIKSKKYVVKKCDDKIYLPVKVFYFLFFCYLTLKLPSVLNVVTEISNGSFLSNAQLRSESRYTEQVSLSILERISSIFFIAYFVSAGMISNIRKKSVIFLLLLGALVESSSLARAGVLLALFGLILELLIRNSEALSRLSFGKQLRISLFFIVILLIIFLFSAAGRLLESDVAIFDVLIQKFGSYTIALYSALLIWLESYEMTFNGGYNTFTTFYKLFGVEVPQGFYGLVETQFGPTNVYTVLRGIIQDFTPIGAMLLFFFFGYTLIKFDLQETKSLSLYFLVRTLAYIFIFILISPYVYAVSTFGFLLPFIILYLISFLRINFGFKK